MKWFFFSLLLLYLSEIVYFAIKAPIRIHSGHMLPATLQEPRTNSDLEPVFGPSVNRITRDDVSLLSEVCINALEESRPILRVSWWLPWALPFPVGKEEMPAGDNGHRDLTQRLCPPPRAGAGGRPWLGSPASLLLGHISSASSPLYQSPGTSTGRLWLPPPAAALC